MNTPPQTPATKKKLRLWIVLAILFVALLIGLGLGGVLGKRYAARLDRRAKLAEVEKQRRELVDSARASVEEGKPSGASDRLTKFGESIGKAAESTSGAERQGLLVAQRTLQSMAPSLGAYEKAYKELQEAEPMEVQKIDSREALASRRAAAKQFAEANEELLKIIGGIEARVRVELEKEGYPERKRDEFVAGFLRSANVDLTLKVRECDREFTETIQKVLALLDREWGAWKVQDGNIQLDKAPAVEEYNGLIGKLEEIGVRQAAAQDELVNRTSKQPPIR